MPHIRITQINQRRQKATPPISNLCKENVLAVAQRTTTKCKVDMSMTYATIVAKWVTGHQFATPSIWGSQEKLQELQQPRSPHHATSHPLIRHPPLPLALQPKIAQHKQTCWQSLWSALNNKMQSSKPLNHLFKSETNSSCSWFLCRYRWHSFGLFNISCTISLCL